MDIFASRFTPINKNDTSCDQTSAVLAIYNIDPEIVSEKLDMMPTTSQKIGSIKIMRNGKKVIGTVNSWILSPKPDEVESKDIRDHLDWLLDKIIPLSGKLSELQSVPGVKMAVRCIWWTATGGGGPTLWPEQMGKLAELNLECGISFADYSEENVVYNNPS